MLLQILHIVNFPVIEGLCDKPHILLWDGQNAHYALLSVSLSRTYLREGYRVGSIVRLMRYCCRTLDSGDKYASLPLFLHNYHFYSTSHAFINYLVYVFNRIIVVFKMNMVKADAIVVGDPPNAEDIRLPNYYFSRPPIPLKRRLSPILSTRQSEYGESSNTRSDDQYSFKKIKIRRCKSIWKIKVVLCFQFIYQWSLFKLYLYIFVSLTSENSFLRFMYQDLFQLKLYIADLALLCSWLLYATCYINFFSL